MKEQFEIIPATKGDYDAIMDIWERSVRASHDFLTEEDILFFRTEIREKYLDTLSTYIMRSTGERIIAFAATSGTHIEMLFVDPPYFGQGVGTRFIEWLIHEKHVASVDVNEQNPLALRFYLAKGFHIAGRDAHDPSGKPYPILHLRLKDKL